MPETIVETVNPATGKVIAKYQNMTDDQIREKVKNARSALKGWKNLDIGERCSLTRNLGRIMRRNKSEYAKLITEEMGKPVRQATAEVEKCAWLCDYYSETAEAFLRDELIPTEFRKSFVCFEPIGVVAGIMPWNFPFWQAMRFAVPAVTAGNVEILKHSSVCLGSAIKLEEAFTDAGFPQSVFQAVIGNSAVGEALIRSDIDAVSITGSVDTGKRVAELASKDLKKFVLELGGSDPFIVLDDADLNQTAYMATQSRLLNTGQSCIAAKRFIVVKEVADKFTKLFVENTEAEEVGDPMDPKTTVGPLVRESQRKALSVQVEDAKNKEGKILTGGNTIGGEGYFYEPTIVSNVTQDMKIIREEVFGPAAPIIIVNNEEEAVMEANNSEFGLGASIWTNNIERGMRLARQIQSGIVSVNEMVKSDPRLPFGGTKSSGIGRELSEFGIREFVNIKSVVVKDIASKLLVE
ncbi:MAG TPA: NAD-dependent succinate-semialdehyde dehydrogenase [Nitrososphaeraceae archaeon]|nr:NAD-dependent succinate-semialdehyde dehydrogenase [Nitrososphaeraceae archaeon]